MDIETFQLTHALSGVEGVVFIYIKMQKVNLTALKKLQKCETETKKKYLTKTFLQQIELNLRRC